MTEQLAAVELVQADDLARHQQPVVALDHIRRLGHAQQPDVGHRQFERPRIDWWRAQLRGDEAAAARLLQPAGLSPNDRWRTG